MKDFKNFPKLSFLSEGLPWKTRLAISLATLFGAGDSPRAPGTVGTFFGVLLFWPIAETSLSIKVAIWFLVFWVGVWAGNEMERVQGKHDDQRIVIDELLGVWVPLLLVPWSWLWVFSAFFLFRLLDVLKPFPANWADQKLPGALGVMIDDVIAGIFALAFLQLGLRYWV